ncbi:hypothetical protein [Microcoleus sp. herbarium5]|uniref:hypothetical protein n=1 Tax=Microcoleus sp. herbarium5 TaxID=3055434 RepID=UPI002FD4D70B
MRISPAELFPGYTFEANEIRIPIAALTGLTAGEANATTGNAMEILRQLVDHANNQVASLAPAARPLKSTIAKQNPSMASGANVVPGTLRQTYTLSFDLQPTALELAEEPTI